MTNNPVVNHTINTNPHLFGTTSPVNVQRLIDLTATHPNQAYVVSVVEGFRNGFWPLATIPDEYPETWDASDSRVKRPDEAQFLRDQRDVELKKGRYSEGFSKLLPGMYAMPIHAVPKDNGNALRLVTNHSKAPYSLNSMVDKSLMPKVPLDDMRSFGEHLLQIRTQHPDKRLVAWKSDVAEAYRLIDMHPHWQIKQVEKVDGVFHVNRCNVFGGTASQFLFIAFMALVSWIAVHVKKVPFLNEYSDDHFGVALEEDISWYEPYQDFFPSPQVALLQLWDYLGIPHKRKKQIWGAVLTIIGIMVDVNELTLTLPDEARKDLLAELEWWCNPKGRAARYGVPLRRWQQLAGWMNWAFNVYPLLRPCLSNVYAKLQGKVDNGQKFSVNNAIRTELQWAYDHISVSTGVHLLDSIHWRPESAEFIIHCDASLSGMGFWIQHEEWGDLGFHAPTVDTQGEEFIFFHEALCVLMALQWLEKYQSLPTRVSIYTDNTNTVDIFNSLAASPRMNPVLIEACDIAINSLVDFKVLYIPGPQNQVADALSRDDFARALSIVPDMRISPFEAPQVRLGRGD